jgi:hypothetical protein
MFADEPLKSSLFALSCIFCLTAAEPPEKFSYQDLLFGYLLHALYVFVSQ